MLSLFSAGLPLPPTPMPNHTRLHPKARSSHPAAHKRRRVVAKREVHDTWTSKAVEEYWEMLGWSHQFNIWIPPLGYHLCFGYQTAMAVRWQMFPIQEHQAPSSPQQRYPPPQTPYCSTGHHITVTIRLVCLTFATTPTRAIIQHITGKEQNSQHCQK